MKAGIAEQARAALRRHVLEPITPRIVDQEYGGFLVDFDERWRPAGPHEKTLEHASRAIVAFALLDQAMPGQGCDALVRHGCAFLQQTMWDSAHGGFFAKVERGGKPCWDGMKHPHAVTYAARAFLVAEPYLPAGEGLLWQRRALAWLEDVAWDPVHGGYWGSFRKNNERYVRGEALPTMYGQDALGDPPGFKEINTFNDALEMHTALGARGLEGCAKRLAWMLDLLLDKLTDSTGCVPYLFWPDWRIVPDVVRIGQHFQLVHRLLAAAALTGTTRAITRAREVCDFCLSSARHPGGGFCLAVAGGGRTWPATNQRSDLRMWWIQLEAARALHALATHEAVEPEVRARYGRARDEQWAFTRDHFFDMRFGGVREFPAADAPEGWRRRLPNWFRAKELELGPVRKTHGWKDPLHETETFLALAETTA